MRNVCLSIAVLICCGLSSVASAAVITDFIYTYNPSDNTPSPSYADSTGTQLNDDFIPSITPPPSYANPGWVGTLNSNPAVATPEVDMTFGQTYNFSSLTITYLLDSISGVDAPASVALSFSTNGSSYSVPQIFTGFDSVDTGVNQYVIDLTGHTDQYIKAAFTAGNNVASGAYVFLGELDFTGTVPEPASVSLLGLGSLLMLRRRRAA